MEKNILAYPVSFVNFQDLISGKDVVISVDNWNYSDIDVISNSPSLKLLMNLFLVFTFVAVSLTINTLQDFHIIIFFLRLFIFLRFSHSLTCSKGESLNGAEQSEAPTADKRCRVCHKARRIEQDKNQIQFKDE